MALATTILALLDSRSFSTIWYWLILAICWSAASRHVLGVPPDVIHRALASGRARADAAEGEPTQESAALALLDWLSLMVPRWLAPPREGAILLGIGCFILAMLFFLGFRYGLEMAQALFLLGAPLALVAVLQFRLARRLARLLEEAQSGRLTPVDAAQKAARQMRRLRFLVTGMSVLVVALSAFWGALWLVAHPYGF